MLSPRRYLRPPRMLHSMLLLCAGLWSLGCCDHYRVALQAVNTVPLDSAPSPPDGASIASIFPREAGWIVTLIPYIRPDDTGGRPVESVRFDGRSWTGAAAGPVVLTVSRYSAASDAFVDFARLREYYHDGTNIFAGTEHGRADDRCLVSAWVGYRLQGDIPRLPFVCAYDYHSLVAFQKGTFLLVLEESAPRPGGSAKNGVIERVAAALSARASNAPSAFSDAPPSPRTAEATGRSGR